jgi:hypothetical protein
LYHYGTLEKKKQSFFLQPHVKILLLSLRNRLNDQGVAPKFSLTRKNGAQYFSNSSLVLYHDGFDLPLLASNQTTQAAAVHIEHTTEKSGAMELQEVFNLPVKTLCAIIGNEKQPGNPFAAGKPSSFPKVVNPLPFSRQLIRNCLQPPPNMAVKVGPLKYLFQGNINADHGNRKNTAGQELDGTGHQDMTNGSGNAVSF